MDRDTIFISHASPDDNEFVRWLGDQLTSRGYTVWADVFHLKGGTPFWSAIEEALRQRSVKVIFVVSRQSVDPARSGVRNELSVADGLRKSLKDPGFIVPVRIDDTPFDSLPIQIHQLNTLDFSADRNARLGALLDTLEAGMVPRQTDESPAVRGRVVPDNGGTRSSEPEKTRALSSLPTLAVLPFVNIGGEAQQDYFVEGVVQEMSTALSRFRSFAVVAREVGRDGGADYLLEGSMRKAGARVRITARLIEATKGALLWAQNFEGALEDVFEFQDRITAQVASIVEPMMKRAELDRSRLKPPSSLGAYDLYLQAVAIVYRPEAETNRLAVELIERALLLDPDYAPALAVAASAYLGRWDRQLPGVAEADRIKGLGYAQAALSAAEDDAYIRAVGGLAVMTLGDEFETGMIALRQAVDENPNSVSILTHAGIGAIHAGDLEEAEGFLLRAISLNNLDFGSQWSLGGMAHIRIAQGRFEEALDWALRAHAASRRNHATHWMLTAANAHLGRMGEAVRWREALQQILPSTTIESIRRGQRMRDPNRIEVVLLGLQLAGLPER